MLSAPANLMRCARVNAISSEPTMSATSAFGKRAFICASVMPAAASQGLSSTAGDYQTAPRIIRESAATMSASQLIAMSCIGLLPQG